MCMFTSEVQAVSDTRIFGRLEGGRQFLAYEMRFAALGDLAMVLPLPVPPSSAEDAVGFIDLSGYPELFDDLDRLFPRPQSGAFSPGVVPARQLAVHDVGAFEASFVPTIADFARLDKRFRLKPAVWKKLPRYADYGFAVFKLRGTDGGLFSRLGRGKPAPQHAHPMAFSFPTRRPDALFFPTVHVHDGEVHATAQFDHQLFCQSASAPTPPLGIFWPGAHPPQADVTRAAGLLVADAPCFRLDIRGPYHNEDIVAPLR